MRRVLYGGGTFVTGDAVAEALLDYGRVLAGCAGADTVHVPAVVEGRRTTVEVLIGPSSQLMTEPVVDDGTLEAPEFVDELAERSRALAPAPDTAPTPTAGPTPTYFDDL